MLLNIDWKSLLLGSEDWGFLTEVGIRSGVMFVVILCSLRLMGKRSVTQLSVFELGVIIGLGSAAGDPMFYKDVGLLPGVLVFVVVIALYRFMTFMINQSEKVEKALEGEPVYLVENGRLNIKNFEKEPIAHEELFGQLRQHNVSHLGQVQWAIIETNGLISLLYFADDEVQWGLPVLPHLSLKKMNNIAKPGKYACTHCGQVADIEAVTTQQHLCGVCGKNEWLEAIKSKRIA